MSETKFEFPTETVELPSKGLVYPEDNPLSSGKIEMKYMTAKEEDILSNQNYIEKGTVIDKLLQSLIVSKIDYRDLIVGDKNAIVIAARILGYGKEYKFTMGKEEYTVDLSKLENKKIDENVFSNGVNEFNYILPHSNTPITFKLLTHKDETAIDNEVRGLKKLSKTSSPELSTKLKYIITSVNGDTDKSTIRKFVDNYLLAMDSRALRNYLKEFQPDISLSTTVTDSDGVESIMDIPFTLNFFWPDLQL
jgi:hypothetical protein